MSFGGGSQGTIRYQLIIDDAQANQKIGTFKNSLTQLAPATASVNREMGALANNFKGTTGGLTQQNTLIGQMTQQHKSLGTQIKDTSARFSGLAIGISATASSALSLAAGFRDYNDAQIQVERVTRRLSLAHETLTKAQDKLNKLQASGVKSGKDYQQAQLDVQQAQQQVDIQTQLLGESQERLFDSQTQFVVSIVPTVIGAFGTMGAAIKAFSGPDGIGGATGAVGTLQKALSSGFSGQGFIGLLGPIGLAVTAAALLISKLEEMKQKTADAFHQFKLATVDTSFLQNPIKAMAELQANAQDTEEVLKRVGAKSTWDLNTHMKEFIGQAIQMGAVVDKNGHIMKTFVDRNIQIGDAFKKNGESAATWIHSMEIYLEKSKGTADILGKLKTAGFDDATAKKLAAAAYEDYNNKVKAGLTIQQQATKSTSQLAVTTIDEYNATTKATDALWAFLEPAKQLTALDVKFSSLGKSTATVFNAQLVGNLQQAKQGITGIKDTINTLKWGTSNPIDLINQSMGMLNTQGVDWNATADEMEQKNKDLENSFISLAEDGKKSLDSFLGSMIQTLDMAPQKMQNALDEIRKAAHLELFTVFDVKTPEDQFKKLAGKFESQFEKQLKKMHIKFDVDKVLDLEGKTEGFKMLVAKIVNGMTPFIENNDKLADAMAKALANMAPNTPEGNKIKKWLENAISKTNTAQILQQGIDSSGKTLTIPSALSFESNTAGGNTSAENEQNGVDAAFITKHYLKVTRANPVLIPAALEFDPTFGQPQGPQGEGGTNEKGQPVDRKGNFITKKPSATVATLQINNTAAIRAIDVVAKRIASLSTIQAVIKLANTAAIKITDVVAKRIDSLTTIKPLISLQNKVAIRNTDVVAKRIDDLTGLKPSISLTNTKALKVVDAVAKRIDSLNNIPVTVKVKFSGSGTISGAASGSIKVAQHGMHEQLKENTLILAHKGEAVDINPHPTSNSNAVTGNSGTIIVNLTNVNSDRETTRVFRRKLGEHQFRFGPR